MDDVISKTYDSAGPARGSTVIREAFDSVFTLHFSDHSSISVTKSFALREADGTTSLLTVSPTCLAPHALELVGLIGMEVASVDAGDNAIRLVFTSGISLVLPRSATDHVDR